MNAIAFFSLTDGRIAPETIEEIAREVAEVEMELERRVDSQVTLVRAVGTHTLRAGGKRLRPALVTLAAKATGLPFEPDRTRKLGACMELIHMATLVHDDVIDHAETRRGERTAAAVFGNTASILSGDVLLAKAMAILAEDGDLEIIRNVSKAVVDLAEGEVLELETRGRFDLDTEKHFEILRRKTATFIQSCCEVGGLAARASSEAVEVLGAYGYHLGMAFQIADDILDYRGNGAETGKPKATDFREGCATLPLIFLVSKLDEREADAARGWFGNGVSDEEISEVCRWMAERGAFEEAEAEARKQAAMAQDAVRSLPDSEDRRLLESVAELVVSRSA